MTSHYSQLLRHYRGLIALTFVALVGGTAVFSVFFLFVTPLYTGTAKVSLLPTQSELAFSQAFVRSTSVNPANLMAQTHIEYLISREVSARTINRLLQEFPAETNAADAPDSSLTARLKQFFHSFRRNARRVYNILNSGKHVPLDPLTDAVLTLQDAIDVEMVEGTYILAIEVTWDNPAIAAAAANYLAEEYVQYARAQADEASIQMERSLREEIASGASNFAELEDQINALRLARANKFSLLRVIDPAVPSDLPSFPKVVVYTVFSFAGWLLVSAFLVISADTFSRTVKTDSDLERPFGALALGTISLRNPNEQTLASAMNMQCEALPDEGAVTVIGNDADSRLLCQVADGALNTLTGWQQVAEQARAHEARRASLRQRRRSAGQSSGPVIPLGRWASEQVRQRERMGNGVTDLGGSDESFSMGKVEDFNWILIGLRPGNVTEEALEATIRKFKDQGVENVFGAFLAG